MCNTTQVLTLTHELATVEELEPYLSWRFRPARPMLMFGRSYKMSPQCSKAQSVTYFWKDRDPQREYSFGAGVSVVSSGSGRA